MAKYAVTENLDVIGAYYHYIQNSFFGTPAGGPAPCSGTEHPQCAGTFDGISAAIDWRFAPKWDLYSGIMFTQVNGGLAFGFLQRNNISHGRIALPLLKAADYLASPSTTGQGGLVPVRAAAGLRVDQERDRLGADRARVGDWSKYESAVGTNAKCRPR